MKLTKIVIAFLACLVCFGSPSTLLGSDKQELAKKLNNPVAALISVPFQFNYDQIIGREDDGKRWTP